MSDYKPKIVYVDYAVYYTEENLDNSMQPETFENIISTNSTFYSQGELTVNPKGSKVAKKKKTSIGSIVFISCICALIAGVAGLIGGKYLFGKTQAAPVETVEVVPSNEDGMIIPEQAPIEADAEQITVSIDRSYLAIPTEDLELKGALVDGKAAITLPEFDKTDFFTHVSGYTWGFSSVPDGKKIEYYGGQTYNFTENKKLYRVLVKYGTRIYIDEMYLLFKSEQSSQFFYELYKRARKWGGVPTGITQNVEDLLRSEQARSMLSNTEFVVMLAQNATI